MMEQMQKRVYRLCVEGVADFTEEEIDIVGPIIDSACAALNMEYSLTFNDETDMYVVVI